jgi:hypothetical protein
MKTYIADIIPNIQRYSKRLDDLPSLKTTYIFRSNGELLISENGTVDFDATFDNLDGAFTLTDDAVGLINFIGTR